MFAWSWWSSLRRPLAGCAVLLGLGLAAPPAPAAQTSPVDGRVAASADLPNLLRRSSATATEAAAWVALQGPKIGAKNGPRAKLGLGLSLLYEQHVSGGPAAVRQAAPSTLQPSLSTDGSRVLIDAIANPGAAPRLLALMTALGLEQGQRFGSVVSGRMPVGQLAALAQLVPLAGARPSLRLTQVGSVTSQGDEALEADDARATFAVDGSGLTVGVLSDSFDNNNGTPLTDYAADVLSGDLPPGVAAGR